MGSQRPTNSQHPTTSAASATLSELQTWPLHLCIPAAGLKTPWPLHLSTPCLFEREQPSTLVIIKTRAPSSKLDTCHAAPTHPPGLSKTSSHRRQAQLDLVRTRLQSFFKSLTTRSAARSQSAVMAAC